MRTALATAGPGAPSAGASTLVSPTPSPPGPPMTLGNMRSLGVRSLFVTCELCHHEAVLSAERWGDAMLVREFRSRMVCTACGIVGADARPNWLEFKASGSWQAGPAVTNCSFCITDEN